MRGGSSRLTTRPARCPTTTTGIRRPCEAPSPLSLAAIAADELRREISIDSGAEVWHLKASSAKEFSDWAHALERASRVARGLEQIGEPSLRSSRIPRGRRRCRQIRSRRRTGNGSRLRRWLAGSSGPGMLCDDWLEDLALAETHTPGQLQLASVSGDAGAIRGPRQLLPAGPRQAIVLETKVERLATNGAGFPADNFLRLGRADPVYCKYDCGGRRQGREEEVQRRHHSGGAKCAGSLRCTFG